MQILMCSDRSTCGMRSLETMIRLIGRIFNARTWCQYSYCCLGCDNEGAERGNTGLLQTRLIVRLMQMAQFCRNISTEV